jgi:hypothetical protein
MLISFEKQLNQPFPSSSVLKINKRPGFPLTLHPKVREYLNKKRRRRINHQNFIGPLA